MLNQLAMSNFKFPSTQFVVNFNATLCLAKSFVNASVAVTFQYVVLITASTEFIAQRK